MNHRIVFTLLLLFTAAIPGIAQANRSHPQDTCFRWRTQVDPKLVRVEIDEAALTDTEAEEGIRCLLEFQTLNGKPRFDGYTRMNLSKSEAYKPHKKRETIAIAALYYVSFLFTNNWEHAGSVQLFDPATWQTNSKSITERAYKSYRQWFKRIKQLGLKRARELKLDPLEGSGISWS